MGKGMNTLKPIKDATTSFSRSVLGTLLFAFGLFLCSSFSAQAHIDNDVSRQFEALLEAAPSADVFKAQHSELEGNDIGPQLQRFDAVDEDSALVEASSGWRQLDAALARSERNLFASISETLNGNISQTTARTPKSVTDKPCRTRRGMPPRWPQRLSCRRFPSPRWRCPSARPFASFPPNAGSSPTPRLLHTVARASAFPSFAFCVTEKP